MSLLRTLVSEKTTQPYNIYKRNEVYNTSITINGYEYTYEYLFQAKSTEGIIDPKYYTKVNFKGTGKEDEMEMQETVKNPYSYFYLPLYKKNEETKKDEEKLQIFDPNGLNNEYLTIVFVKQVCRSYDGAKKQYYGATVNRAYYYYKNKLLEESEESPCDGKNDKLKKEGEDDKYCNNRNKINIRAPILNEQYFYKRVGNDGKETYFLVLPININKEDIQRYYKQEFICGNYWKRTCSIPNTSADEVWGKRAKPENCRSCDGKITIEKKQPSLKSLKF